MIITWKHLCLFLFFFSRIQNTTGVTISPNITAMGDYGNNMTKDDGGEYSLEMNGRPQNKTDMVEVLTTDAPEDSRISSTAEHQSMSSSPTSSPTSSSPTSSSPASSSPASSSPASSPTSSSPTSSSPTSSPTSSSPASSPPTSSSPASSSPTSSSPASSPPTSSSPASSSPTSSSPTSSTWASVILVLEQPSTAVTTSDTNEETALINNSGRVLLVMFCLAVMVMCGIIYYLRRTSRTYSFDFQWSEPEDHAPFTEHTGTFQPIHLDDLDNSSVLGSVFSDSPAPSSPVANGKDTQSGVTGVAGHHAPCSGEVLVVIEAPPMSSVTDFSLDVDAIDDVTLDQPGSSSGSPSDVSFVNKE